MSRAIVNQTNESASVKSGAANINSQAQPTTKILRRGCITAAFLLPIKLSLTYIVLAPLIVYWFYINRSAVIKLTLPSGAREITAPLCAFIAVAMLSGSVGISPLHSLPALASLLFFALTIPVYAGYAQVQPVCLALVAGQAVAAFHSFIDAALPDTIPGLFIGKVTESGQLAIMIPITIGLILLGLQSSSRTHTESDLSDHWLLPICAGIITATITLLGFQSYVSLPTYVLAGAAAITCGCIYLVARRSSQVITTANRGSYLHAILLVYALPLLICALLVNLKRGPWLGVCVGTGVLVLIYARRLIIPLTLVTTVVAVGIDPVRDRLLASYTHFTIEGGRSTIWRIGFELLSEYPLGIGYHNSGVLREFAPEIPPELKHFHNNLINIATETGWLGAAIFLWLLVAAIRSCFGNIRDPLYVAFGSALISWQVAGLVEYNFGDSEVTIMVWIILGLLLGREIRAVSVDAAS